MEVLDTLRKVYRASHVDSFDFSTLYTKIPHVTFKKYGEEMPFPVGMLNTLQ
jgi:hypothetical protein